jgi:serine kinase of HPr protein (carbohydrate metabolism regulator)
VSIDGRAVLIDGPSGSGKSDLALRLIDRGATLVSDDYTVVQRHAGRLTAVAPPNIAGMIEVRGVGLVPMPFERDIPVAMIASMTGVVERMPDDDSARLIAGISLPVCQVSPLEASAPIKVEMMLKTRGLS